MSKVVVVVRMDGQIIHGRCWFARGDVGKGIVPGAGEGDADSGEEGAEDGRWGDSGVLFLAVLSPAFPKRFKREYLAVTRAI